MDGTSHFSPLIFRRSLLRVAECWFSAEDVQTKVDIVRYVQLPSPIRGMWCQPFQTLQTDLRVTEDELFIRLDRGTRYEIKRAQSSDDILHLTALAPSDFLKASEVFNESHPGVPTPNAAKLSLLEKSHQLAISATRSKEGESLSWHVYVLSGRIARLLYSATMTRSDTERAHNAVCGRANRLHHWLDMKHFRDRGYLIYDFGGYYAGGSDRKLINIDRFKRGFGGDIVMTYNALRGITVVGRLAVAVWRMAGRTI